MYMHNTFAYRSKASNLCSPIPPTSKTQIILISAGQNHNLWKKQERSLGSEGVHTKTIFAFRSTSTSRAPCDLTARGLQPAPLHRWGLTYGRGKRYSVYSVPAILNVLFNNLSREEALLLIFNTKCACRFATVSCLKVLLAAHTQIVIFPLIATCLSTWSHNSWGITTSSKLAFLFCFMDCLRPFPPLSPAFFFYF